MKLFDWRLAEIGKYNLVRYEIDDNTKVARSSQNIQVMHSFVPFDWHIWIFVYFLAAQTSARLVDLNSKQSAKGYERIIWEIF